MKKTLAKVISGTMCALVAVMLPIYTAKAAGPKVKNVVMEDSPRYFHVGEDYYRFELIFEGGLESYSWTYLETQFTVGINVEMVDSSEADIAEDLLTSQGTTIQELYGLRNALAHDKTQFLYSETDWDQNGNFEIEDLVYFVRKYANNPQNFLMTDPLNMRRMDLENLLGILNYHKEHGDTEFVVRPYDKAPTIETTETTAQTTESTTTTTVQTTTTTAKPTTASTAQTTTTTAKPTTTTTVQTTTTTAKSTTATTVQTTATIVQTTEFTVPDMFDLIDEYNQPMSEEEYNCLLESAKMFGLEYYKIIWTEEMIQYSLAIPSDSYSLGDSSEDWKCFQLCPIQDFEKILPDYNWRVTGCNLMVWRPETDGTININATSQDYYWKGTYCYVIIPLKLNEKGELVEDLRILYPTTSE